MKAQVRRAVLLDPNWPAPRSLVMERKAPLERERNELARAMLDRVAAGPAAKRRKR